MQDLTSLPEDAGVMICGHGSRAKIAEQEFSLLAAGLRARFPSLKIEYGFLEYASPNIHMGLDSLIAQGVKKIYAVPGMLFRATHAKNDIPSVLTTYMQKHPVLEIRYGRELGLHKQMIKAFEHRVLEALGLDETPKAGELYDTMLVVVGRGTSVATANAEAAKLTRIVAENLGFGWSETVYSGVTFPSVGAGLEMALKLGFKRIVVAPYFLFSGRLIGRIQSYVDKVVNENPNVDFRVADYLRDQTHVIDTFIVRIAETVAQESHHHGHENDLMQDFNRRLAAGEVDVHHHHAEFQPHNHADEPHNHADEPHNHADEPYNHADEPHNHADEPHNHADEPSHSHDHSHGHSHAPYKHIAHPYGPRTMIDENVCCCFMSQFPDEVIALERAKRSARGLAKVEQTPQCQKK